MKRICFVITINVVLLALMSCATVNKAVVVPGTPLSAEKAYIAGVFNYGVAYNPIHPDYSPTSPVISFSGQTGSRAHITFPSAYISRKNPVVGEQIIIVEVEPDDYTVEPVTMVVNYFPRTIMRVPAKIKREVPVKAGTVYYVGHFSIHRKSTWFVIGTRTTYETNYHHDLDDFVNRLRAEYTVPASLVVQ